MTHRRGWTRNPSRSENQKFSIENNIKVLSFIASTIHLAISFRLFLFRCETYIIYFCLGETMSPHAVEISDMYPIMQCNNHRGGSANLWSRAWKTTP